MGYTTNFKGYFKLDKPLTINLYEKLMELHEQRHSYETHPSIWCQWIPTPDGDAIIWDGGEKFYSYAAWLEYIIEKHLKPNNYVLNGRVFFRGERMYDCGYITVKDNKTELQYLEMPEDYISRKN